MKMSEHWSNKKMILPQLLHSSCSLLSYNLSQSIIGWLDFYSVHPTGITLYQCVIHGHETRWYTQAVNMNWYITYHSVIPGTGCPIRHNGQFCRNCVCLHLLTIYHMDCKRFICDLNIMHLCILIRLDPRAYSRTGLIWNPGASCDTNLGKQYYCSRRHIGTT